MNSALLLLLAASALAAVDPGLDPRSSEMQTAVLVKQSIPEVRRLLDAGFDPNTSIGWGEWPAILGAVQSRNLEMAQLLLERGAKIPDRAMLQACGTYNQDLAFPQLLIQHGANINAADDHSSCLHTAVWHRNLPLLELLCHAKGIDLNVIRRDGNLDGTPLMWALRSGATEVASLLLANGADPAAKGESGATAASIVQERLQTYEKLRAALSK